MNWMEELAGLVLVLSIAAATWTMGCDVRATMPMTGIVQELCG